MAVKFINEGQDQQQSSQSQPDVQSLSGKQQSPNQDVSQVISSLIGKEQQQVQKPKQNKKVPRKVVFIKDTLTGDQKQKSKVVKEAIKSDIFNANKLISTRGILDVNKSLDNLTSEDTGIGTKTLAALDLISQPLRRVEASMANVGLAVQAGVIDPKFLLDEATSGIKGAKLGEFGDILQTGGFPAPAAATLGLIATFVTPLELISKSIRASSQFAKLGLKGVTRTGQNIVKASDDALLKLGKGLDEVYAPVNTLKVNSNKLLDSVVKMPKAIVKEIEEQLGANIEDIVSTANIQTTRKIKSILGRFRASAFGKTEKGVAETIDSSKVERAYAGFKSLIQDTLTNKGLGKQGKKILEADDAFSEMAGATKFLKKKIVDPTTRKAVGGKKLAQAFGKRDPVVLDSLDVLKKAGGSIQRNMKRAIIELDDYNRLQTGAKVIKRGTELVGQGVVVGSVIGKLTGRD